MLGGCMGDVCAGCVRCLVVICLVVICLVVAWAMCARDVLDGWRVGLL